MKPAVGVRFKRAGKIYYFEAADCPDIGIGHQVVVDTSQGRELGRVVIAPDQLVEARPAGRLKPIVRVASSEDLEEQRQLRGRESEVLGEVMSEIVRLKLPMRAVMAEYSFDASRLTVYFVSEEQRVDFRDLVRDLTKRYDARVNLRQIGPRDRAKLLGGIDRCGRELCCTTWMPDFQPIQIRMAKNQQLPLNPSEISGVCGKLLCCLPGVSMDSLAARFGGSLGYRDVFRVVIMQFLDRHSMDLRSVRKSCVHIAHPDGERVMPFDTYNLFYRGALEETVLTPLRRRVRA